MSGNPILAARDPAAARKQQQQHERKPQQERQESDAHPAPPPLIVIGGSAGAIPVVQDILSKLPGDFPAALLIVVHQSQSPSAGSLTWLFNRIGALAVRHARDGER